MAPRVEPLRPAELRALRALTSRSVRARRAGFLLEGFRGIESALEVPGRVLLVALSPAASAHPRAKTVIDRGAEAGSPVRTGSAEALADLADSVTAPGVIARVHWQPHRQPGTTEVIEALGHDSCRRLLCLDAVSDPGNVGTLIRTAQAFGVDGILLGKGTVEATNPKVVRSAVGSLFHLAYVAEGVDLNALLPELENRGWRVFRAEAATGTPPAPTLAGAPWALVVGSEAHGVSEGLRATGTPLHIPVAESAESLNAAVAGSILLYELSREPPGR
jgi:TrmH family RNA methyltransferase